MDKPYTIGSAAMRKIMEIEGVTLTDQDIAFLDELGRVQLTERERTDRIVDYVKRTVRAK